MHSVNPLVSEHNTGNNNGDDDDTKMHCKVSGPCRDKVALDETFAACGHRRSDNFDCNAFNPMVCTRDAIPFCLHNGTIVRGTCLAKRAVCL